MSLFTIFVAVIFTGLAVSYGWGIRGCVIGGEKGAMLPGALLGYCIAMFCGNGALSGFYPFFCAAGALSMFYGGTETYAQTMSFILNRDDKNSFAYNKLSKGVAGIFLKGGLWFGICAMILAMLPSALSGKYTQNEIIIMFLLFPVVSFIGTKIFNSPYDKIKNVFPKIYFSHDRREEWGSNVMIIAELSAFALLKQDCFSLISASVGFIFGGLGFTLGLFAYDFTERKHNGKYFFGKLQEKGYIDGWKIMEHFFGAFSGGGVMLWFCLNSKRFAVLSEIKHYSDVSVDRILSFAVVGMLLLTSIQYIITWEYKKRSDKKPDIHIFELIERPLISSVPLIFVFLGYRNTSVVISLITLVYLLCEKCGLEWFSEFKSAKKIKLTYFLIFIAVTVYCFLVNFAISPFCLITLWTVGYSGSVFLYSHIGEKRADRKNKGLGYVKYYKSTFSVDYHFLAESIVIIAVAGVFNK